MYVKVRGVRLWFDVLSSQIRVDAEGPRQMPTVVGVHGGPGIDSTGLVEVLGPLADVAHLIRYDQRGHGRSERGVASEWTVDNWADDLAELIRRLVEGPVILLGTSFGARVALACAARQPEVVRAVIAAYGGGRLDESATIGAFERLGGPAAARAARGQPEDPQGSMQEWLRVCWPLVARTDRGRQHLAHVQRISSHSPEVNAAYTSRGEEDRLPDGLANVRCPVLVLGGIDDPLSSPSVLTELAAAIPGVATQLCLVSEAGHALFADQPAAAYAKVRQFIAEQQVR